MPLFKRRAIPIPATQHHTGPSPMTRLKRMLAPRRTRHTNTHTAGGSGAAVTNPVAAVEREGRRAKRFFTRRAHAATGGGAPVTTHRRRRGGLFSSRRAHGHGGPGHVAAVPVAGGGGPHRKTKFSLASLFSRHRAPHNRHTNHAGGHLVA